MALITAAAVPAAVLLVLCAPRTSSAVVNRLRDLLGAEPRAELVCPQPILIDILWGLATAPHIFIYILARSRAIR